MRFPGRTVNLRTPAVWNPCRAANLSVGNLVATRDQLAAFTTRLRESAARRSTVSLSDLLVTIAPPVIVFLLIVTACFHFLKPLPPRTMMIATGNARGIYSTYAEHYAQLFRTAGITLKVMHTQGAGDNLALLKDPANHLDAAILQDGVAPQDDPAVRSVGAIGYEPIWVFYRSPRPWSRLSDLAGKRVNIGRWGAGSQFFALEVLREAGLTWNVEAFDPPGHNVHLTTLNGQEALDALRAGQLDAVITLGDPSAATVQAYFHSPGVRALSLTQAEAIARHRPFLHRITIPRGGIDLNADLPDADLETIATTSVVYVRADVHPALVTLLSQAMRETHGEPGLLNAKHEFPSDKDQTVPLHAQAERFLRNGPPLLMRYLPFWLATLLDRTFVVVVPLLALLIPATRVIPQVYTWRIRRRLDRWYGELKFLESELGRDDIQAERNLLLDRLAWIEQQLEMLRLPLSFSNQLYVLREHLELVRRRVLRVTRASIEAAAVTAPVTAAVSPSPLPGVSASPGVSAPGGKT